MVKAFMVAATMLLVLGGCTGAGKAFLAASIQATKDAKDTEARLLLLTLCAMSVGAKNRILTSDQIDHVEGLCGGDVDPNVLLVPVPMQGGAPRFRRAL